MRLLVALLVLLHLPLIPLGLTPAMPCVETAAACGVERCCEGCGDECPCAAQQRTPPPARPDSSAWRGVVDPALPCPDPAVAEPSPRTVPAPAGAPRAPRAEFRSVGARLATFCTRVV